MDNCYKILEWDSNFFGYKVAYIKLFKLELKNLTKIIKDLDAKDFKLIYCFTDPSDEISNKSVRNSSGFLADEKITFNITINDEDRFLVSNNIHPYKLDYASKKLKSLALESGFFSRFRIDPHFQNEEYKKLYLEWIEKSVKKIVAKEILIYYINDEEKGFVTLDINSNIGSIKLIAVDQSERGKSIGKELMRAALFTFRERKINKVEVVTQKANRIACKFYQSLGFTVKNVDNIYHIWIK